MVFDRWRIKNRRIEKILLAIGCIFVTYGMAC